MKAAVRRTLRPVKRAYRALATALRQSTPVLLKHFFVAVPAVVDGVRWRVPLIRGIGLQNREGHEPWMTDLLRRLLAFTRSPGLLDVGVNIGQTLLKLKSIDPEARYFGFEPNPFCVLFTTELIRLNDFRHCELYPVALSDAPGLLGFVADSEADPAGSMLADFRPGKAAFRKQYIAALVFDDLALAEAEACTLVKIDVEGAELHVLRGMQRFLKSHRPVVVCEVLHAHSEAKVPDLALRNAGIVDLLHATGYAAYRLHKGAERVEALEPVDGFPDVVWHERSSELCDYVLVPAEKSAALAAFFASP